MPLQGRETEFQWPILTNFMVSTKKKPKIVNIKIFKPKKIILKYYFRDISLESDKKKVDICFST